MDISSAKVCIFIWTKYPGLEAPGLRAVRINPLKPNGNYMYQLL
jgi:hypothetical protein